MIVRFRLIAAACALLALVTTAAGPAAPASAGGCGPTVKTTLSGPAFNGVVPQGQAQADESQYLCGGDTIMTVQVKNVNLPDGTVVNVILDFAPKGTLTLNKQQGTMRVNLGHFALGHDEVRVSYGGTVILDGWNFQ